MKIRYDIAPAEVIRKEKSLTPQQFSRRIGYDGRSYEFAIERGYLSYRMMRDVCARFKVPLSTFKRIEDGVGGEDV